MTLWALLVALLVALLLMASQALLVALLVALVGAGNDWGGTGSTWGGTGSTWGGQRQQSYWSGDNGDDDNGNNNNDDRNWKRKGTWSDWQDWSWDVPKGVRGHCATCRGMFPIAAPIEHRSCCRLCNDLRSKNHRKHRALTTSNEL